MRVEATAEHDGVNIAKIVGPYKGRKIVFGEVYLFDGGRATVYDDFWGGMSYFDIKEHGHHDAMRYVVTRIVEDCELVW